MTDRTEENSIPGLSLRTLPESKSLTDHILSPGTPGPGRDRRIRKEHKTTSGPPQRQRPKVIFRMVEGILRKEGSYFFFEAQVSMPMAYRRSKLIS